MNVRELIQELECKDQHAEVRIMSQPSWPFEYSISGVVDREAIKQVDRDHDYEGEPDEQNDVFLLEGSQLCYGDKNAWDAC